MPFISLCVLCVSIWPFILLLRCERKKENDTVATYLSFHIISNGFQLSSIITPHDDDDEGSMYGMIPAADRCNEKNSLLRSMHDP